MFMKFIICALVYLGAPDYSQEILDASEQYKIPPLLIIAIIERENKSWKLGVEGAYGDELGMMQVYPYGRSFCKCGKMKTAADEINCGTCWFAEGWKMCKGNMEGALSAYASGKCTPPSVGVERAVNRKLRTYRKIKLECAKKIMDGTIFEYEN